MITILIGKSASGKDTLLNNLVKDDFIPIISTTSRPIREGEKDGEAYNFISKDEFEKRIKDNKFLEYRSYNTLVNGIPDTWYYGTEKKDLHPYKNYVTVLDIEGTKAFLEHYGKEDCTVVAISVPDRIREERAKKRGSFNQTEWDRRLKDDNLKFSEEEINKVADFTIDNSEGDVQKLTFNFYKGLSKCAEKYLPEYEEEELPFEL